MAAFTPQYPESANKISLTQIKKNLRTSLLERNEPTEWLEGLIFEYQGSSLQINFIHFYFFDWFQRAKRTLFEIIMRQNFAGLEYSFLNSIETIKLSRDAGSAFRIRCNLRRNINDKKIKENNIFDDYIFNEKNSFQLGVIRKAARIIDTNFPVLVICGISGTGKSHLLKKIICSIKNQCDNLDPVFLTGKEFSEQPEYYLKKLDFYWHQNPVLVIDDIQYIADNVNSQNILAEYMDEFEAVFNTSSVDAHEYIKGRLIFAFSGKMSSLKIFTARLRSRLENNLVIELQEPDLEVRLKYLELANRNKKLGLGRQHIVLLARYGQLIPVLNGFLQKLEFFVSLKNRIPTLQELNSLIGDANYTKPANWKSLVANIASGLKLKPEEILGKNRKPEVVLARQIAMYICRQKFGLSYPEIGKIFNGKDHSTVMHSVEKIKTIIATDEDMHKFVTNMENADN